MEKKVQRVGHMPPAPTQAQPLPPPTSGAGDVHLCRVMNPRGRITIVQILELTAGLPPGAAYSVGLDECVIVGFCPVVSHGAVSLLNILCALPICPSLTKPLATCHRSTVSAVLPFPECRLVGLTWCVAFSDWLCSLSAVDSSCFPVFSCLMVPFLF